MTGFVLRRCLAGLLLIWIVLTIVFVLLHAAPGDPVERLGADPRVPREQVDRLRSVYGLDRPILVQYFEWLRAVVLRGDWGYSFLHQRPVAGVLLEFLPATLALAAFAILIQFALGIPLGIWSALRSGRAADHGIRLATLLIYSVPMFWLALMSVLVFSNLLGWLPPSNASSPFADRLPFVQRLVDWAQHLILPALVLGFPLSAPIARLLRNDLLGALGQDYVRSARSRGLPERRVLIHALRNCMTPMIQIAGVNAPLLLGGAIVVEYVFSWPGLGTTAVAAIESRDYPLVLALTAWSGALVVTGNLIADLVQGLVDPRVRAV